MVGVKLDSEEAGGLNLLLSLVGAKLDSEEADGLNLALNWLGWREVEF